MNEFELKFLNYINAMKDQGESYEVIDKVITYAIGIRSGVSADIPSEKLASVTLAKVEEILEPNRKFISKLNEKLPLGFDVKKAFEIACSVYVYRYYATHPSVLEGNLRDPYDFASMFLVRPGIGFPEIAMGNIKNTCEFIREHEEIFNVVNNHISNIINHFTWE